MVKSGSTLFIKDTRSDASEVIQYCKKYNLTFGGSIIDPTQIITRQGPTEFKLVPGASYEINALVDFDFIVSLFGYFDHVEFFKNPEDILSYRKQIELEFIFNQSNNYSQSKILDPDVLNFFGCSHTYGTGHSETTCYPTVLASKLKLQYINFGKPGISNYVIEDNLSEYAIKNSKLIVQFTDIYRVRYINNGVVVSDSVHRNKHFLGKSTIFNEENLLFNFKKIAERVINRLRDGNNQFLITYTDNFPTEHGIEANIFLHGFKEYCSAVGTEVDSASDNLHYGIESHRLWAERLYKKWNELYGTI